MDQRKERAVLGVFVFIFLILIALPFLYANSKSASESFFTGIIFNPLDGNSYLAKLRQGFEGSWTFLLPYSAVPGAGAAINLYYLFLGHVTRFLEFSLIFTFHLARIMGSAFLFFALFRLSARIFKDPTERWIAYSLASLGSGLGWIALIFGAFTPDFWLSEAFPFLSSLANAHFPLGLALQIILITQIAENNSKNLIIFLISLLLSIIYPFGLVMTAFISFIYWLLKLRVGDERQDAIQKLIAMGMGGGPYLVYQWWIVNNHVVLAQWNAQNITLSPDIWGLLIAFSPAVLFAIPFAKRAWKDGNELHRLMIIWIVAALFAAYLPSNLQRRLLSGVYIPIALIGTWSLSRLLRSNKSTLMILSALLVFSLPSQAILLATGFAAVEVEDDHLYISSQEMEAMLWLDQRAESGALVAASPASALYLPIYSDVQVFYAHPFESIEAERWQDEMLKLFSGQIPAAEFMDTENVDYVFYGPREKELGQLTSFFDWQAIYDQDGIQIFEKIGQ